MSKAVTEITAILFGMAILLLGNGLLMTLLPIRAELEGFGTRTIGLLGAAYFLGFFLGCRFVPDVVRRIGQIRAFAAFASLASALTLLHALFVDPVFWIVVRAVTGFAFAGLYMAVESWLHASATNDVRGSVFSIYMIINLSALAVGQQLLLVASPQNVTLFAVASVCISVALIPVALSRSEAPANTVATPVSLRQLYELSPIGIIGCFLSGLITGPFWILGPLFVQESGFALSTVAFFMSSVIAGGVVLQWPMGRYSDMVDRRRVIAGLFFAVAASSVIMVNWASQALALLLATAFFFGGFAFTLNSLCVAHVNDVMENGDRIAVSAGLLLAWGAGAVLGPVTSSQAYVIVGPNGLFLHAAAMGVAGGVYALIRIWQSRAPKPEDKEPFVLVPRTTPAVFEMDPRIPREEPSGKGDE